MITRTRTRARVLAIALAATALGLAATSTNARAQWTLIELPGWSFTPVPVPSGGVVYEKPRLEGYRVDWCESWAKNCGTPAANRFCRMKRGAGSRATEARIEHDIGKASPTRTLVGKKVCAKKACDGFLKIRCGDPAPEFRHTAPAAPRCELNKGKSFGIGKRKYVRGELVGRVLVSRPEAKKKSIVDGRLRACFARKCATLAKAAVEGRSSGGSLAYVDVAGKRIETFKLSAKGAKDYGPYIAEQKLGGSIEVFPGLRIKAKAGFGAGVEFHAAYDIRALPPMADVDGTAKTFAHGTGGVSASLLDGLIGKAGVEGEMKLPSPDVIADIDTRTCGSAASARVELKPWRLEVRAWAKALCVKYLGCAKSGSKVLVRKSGAAKTYPLF